MPAMHSSVAYCYKCDLIVARDLINPCAECRKSVCPDCAKHDMSGLECCSYECVSKANLEYRREMAKA